ncbi:creatininase family protein [Halovenus sp. WSH3]|uniref:Creatininase family protein n=1 Tax=Halovenus carboxidivorans TaxID=2692199 RepID=A0A6B0T1P9_9EURY|nr:creatininase family protein [Halovenus carboxidivorans]MXR51895.1 creatininase family protein [Halovenus carboxidivorans]
MELVNSTWPEADAAGTSLAVLPVGSTEQHGPHAVLGTDVFTAGAVARAGIEESDRDPVLGPTIPVGIAAEHREFAGTLWVSEDTFRAYVRETCESLLAHGWDRIVLVNGHGGNVAALRELCGTISRSGEGYAVPFTWFDAVDAADISGEAIEMGHGGPVETSVLEHLGGEHVRPAEYDRAAAGAAERWGDWQSGVNLAYDSSEFSESGVVGDPREGSAELGAALLDAAAESLAALLDTVARRERPD